MTGEDDDGPLRCRIMWAENSSSCLFLVLQPSQSLLQIPLVFGTTNELAT